MKRKPTSKQLINAELAARAFNTKAKDVLKNHSPKEEAAELVVDFHCECSDENCQERIALTLKQYEQIHHNRAQFVLAKRHSEPGVEKVAAKTPAFDIVEKYALTSNKSS